MNNLAVKEVRYCPACGVRTFLTLMEFIMHTGPCEEELRLRQSADARKRFDDILNRFKA